MATFILLAVSWAVVWATWEILRSLEREESTEVKYNSLPVTLPPPPTAVPQPTAANLTARRLEVVKGDQV